MGGIRYYVQFMFESVVVLTEIEMSRWLLNWMTAMQTNSGQEVGPRAAVVQRNDDSDEDEAEESVKFVLRKRKRVTTSSLLLPVMLNPGFLGFVGSLPRKRRFWSAHADGDDDGVWEKEILGTWSRLGQDFQGVED